MPRRLRVKFPYTTYPNLVAAPGAFAYAGNPATLRKTAVDAQPATGSRRVNPSTTSTRLHVSALMFRKWDRYGGDYMGADGTRNSGTHHVTSQNGSSGTWLVVPTSSGMTSMVGKMLEENNGILLDQVTAFTPTYYHGMNEANPPKLTIVTTDGTFTPTLLWTRSLSGATGLREPGIIKYDVSSVTGTVVSAQLELYAGNVYSLNKQICLDPLDPPYVEEFPFVQIDGAQPPDIHSITFLSRDSIFEPTGPLDPQLASGGLAEYTYNPVYTTDAKYNVPYLRCGFIQNGDPRSVTWRYHPETTQLELYHRFCNYFPSEAWDGLGEQGTKLSGSDQEDGIGTLWGYILEITGTAYDKVTKDWANPYLYGLYSYHKLAGQNQFVTDASYSNGGCWCVVECNRWYVFELYIRVNSAPTESDGEVKVWVNGNLVHNRTGMLFTTRTGVDAAYIREPTYQIYEGGTSKPRLTHWVGLAECALSTKQIGVPHYFLTPPTPQWRQSKTKDVLYTLSGTAPRTQVVANSLNVGYGAGTWFYAVTDAYTGMATADNAVYLLANGGHNDGNGTNPVLKLDFTQDSPTWSVVNASSPSSAIPTQSANTTARHTHWNDGPTVDGWDGKPAAAHTYYVSQWVPSHNKVLRVGGPAIYAGTTFNSTYVDAFDVVGHTWSAKGTYPNIPTFGSPYVALVTRDPRNDDIYWANGGVSYRWKADVGPVGQWESVTLQSQNDAFSPCIVDPVRNRLVTIRNITLTHWDIGDRSNGIPGDGARTQVTLSGIANVTQEAALVYDPDNDRYLVLNYLEASVGGGVTELYSIDPVSMAVTLMHSSNSNSAIPIVSSNGQRPYNKFAYLKDYQCVIWMCNGTSDLMMMPTV